MNGIFDYRLVAASYAVAVVACYAAIDLSSRLPTMDGLRQIAWLIVDALTLGTGVWSMHFVGMAAYQLPIEMSYDLPLTVASWALAVLGTGMALRLIGSKRLTVANLTGSSLMMGGGICLMHYCGMAAMRLTPAIDYDPFLLCLSVTIALLASAATLFVCSGLRDIDEHWQLPVKAGSAALMGAAICGMHYTGIAAAHFANDAFCAPQNTLRGSWMGLPVAVSAIGFIGLIVLLSVLDNLALERRRRIAGERLYAERLRQRANELFHPQPSSGTTLPLDRIR